MYFFRLNLVAWRQVETSLDLLFNSCRLDVIMWNFLSNRLRSYVVVDVCVYRKYVYVYLHVRKLFCMQGRRKYLESGEAPLFKATLTCKKGHYIG